jgi:hypothetical protein
LLKKELAESLPLLVTASILALYAWNFLLSGPGWLVLIEEGFGKAMFAASLFGPLFGYVQFQSESSRATLGYLRHRGSGERGAFLAKLIVGVLATTWIAIGTVWVVVLWCRLDSRYGSLFDSRPLLDLLWLVPFGAATYACGVLASQLRRTWWLDVAWGGVCAFSLCAVQYGCWWIATSRVEVAMIASVLLVFAGVVLCVSFDLFRRPRDRDLALDGRQTWMIGLTSAVLVQLAGVSLLWYLAQALWNDLDGTKLVLVRERDDGSVHAVRRGPSGRWVLADEHRPDGSSIEAEFETWIGPERTAPKYELVYDSSGESGAVEPHPWMTDGPPPWLHRRHKLTEGDWSSGPRTFEGKSLGAVVLFDSGRGELEVIWDSTGEVYTHVTGRLAADAIDTPEGAPKEIALPGRLPFHRSYTRPDGRPFGPYLRSLRLMPTNMTFPVLLLDPSDRTLWVLDPSDPERVLSRTELPDGDRPERKVELYQQEPARQGRFVWDGNPGLKGDHGVYVFEGDRIVETRSAKGRYGVLADRAAEIADLRTTVDARDPLAIAVTVTRRGEVIARRTLEPRGWPDRVRVAALHVLTLWNPPIVGIVDFLGSERGVSQLASWTNWPLDVLVRGRARAWLLLLQLVIVATLVWRTAHRLERRGAGLGVRVLWLGSVALGGALAHVAFLWLEPRATRAEAHPQIARDPVLRLEST